MKEILQTVAGLVQAILKQPKPAFRYLAGDPRKWVTPFNAVAAVILAVGVPVIGLRLWKGLAAVTNLSQETPWGLWIGFDVLCGVALAAGGYTIAATVYLFGLKRYHGLLRPAVLTGFLGYTFVVIGLILDLGRPWRMPYIMIFPRGVTSVLFEVGWCVALYLAVQAVEFSPTVLEWAGLKKLRDLFAKAAVWLTIFALVLSTLHQSSLGALFLLAPTKLHPLWYSPYIPLYFFVSSIIAGLSMVIVESALSHQIFETRLSPDPASGGVDLDDLTLGLGKAAAVALYAYFFIKLIGLADGWQWDLLATPYGHWYLVELLGFVLLPCLLYTAAVRTRSVKLARFTGAWTVLGILVNRLNVSIIAMNWKISPHYVPSWMEVMVSVTLITMGVLLFRWIVNRMPVMAEAEPIEGGKSLIGALAGKA